MHIYALTQTGVSKIENEDRVIIGKTILTNGVFEHDDFNGFVGIADGVGGNNAGAVASHFVANHVGKLNECTKEQFTAINRDLITASQTDKQVNKMATTLSGVYMTADTAQCVHIGNTRVYSVQSRKYLKQLTVDDTTLNHLLSTGQLTSEDAKQFAHKNEIIACFGAGNESLFDIKIFDISKNASQMYLLTSDGIHDYVTIDELEDILSECNDLMLSCKRIANRSVQNGSMDDISVVIITDLAV